jgi:hypothetical protein
METPAEEGRQALFHFDVSAFIVAQLMGALAASVLSGWLFAEHQPRHEAAATGLQRL